MNHIAFLFGTVKIENVNESYCIFNKILYTISDVSLN